MAEEPEFDDIDPDACWDLARYAEEMRLAKQQIRRLEFLSDEAIKQARSAEAALMRYSGACAQPPPGIYHFSAGRPPHPVTGCDDEKCWIRTPHPDGRRLRIKTGVEVILTWNGAQPVTVEEPASADG
jgi:hypothetical protein